MRQTRLNAKITPPPMAAPVSAGIEPLAQKIERQGGAALVEVEWHLVVDANVAYDQRDSNGHAGVHPKMVEEPGEELYPSQGHEKPARGIARTGVNRVESISGMVAFQQREQHQVDHSHRRPYCGGKQERPHVAQGEMAKRLVGVVEEAAHKEEHRHGDEREWHGHIAEHLRVDAHHEQNAEALCHIHRYVASC